MTRRTRFFAALVSVAALLFTQLAVAAYACPQAVQAPAAERTCEHDVVTTPNICVKHCDEEASLGSSQVSPAAPDVGTVATAFSTAVAALRLEPSGIRPFTQAPHPPPLLTRFTVLRI